MRRPNGLGGYIGGVVATFLGCSVYQFKTWADFFAGAMHGASNVPDVEVEEEELVGEECA